MGYPPDKTREFIIWMYVFAQIAALFALIVMTMYLASVGVYISFWIIVLTIVIAVILFAVMVEYIQVQLGKLR